MQHSCQWLPNSKKKRLPNLGSFLTKSWNAFLQQQTLKLKMKRDSRDIWERERETERFEGDLREAQKERCVPGIGFANFCRSIWRKSSSSSDGSSHVQHHNSAFAPHLPAAPCGRHLHLLWRRWLLRHSWVSFLENTSLWHLPVLLLLAWPICFFSSVILRT